MISRATARIKEQRLQYQRGSHTVGVSRTKTVVLLRSLQGRVCPVTVSFQRLCYPTPTEAAGLRVRQELGIHPKSGPKQPED